MKKIIFILLAISIFACKHHKSDDPQPASKAVSYKITIVNNKDSAFTITYTDDALSGTQYANIDKKSTYVLTHTFQNGAPSNNNIYVYYGSTKVGYVFWQNNQTFTWN